MDSDGLTGSIIILLCVLIKGFFTVCEAAVTEISDSKVKNFENGTKKEQQLFKLLKKPAGLITAFSVNRIFSAVFIAYLALFFYLTPLKDALAVLFKNTLTDTPAYLTSALIILVLSVLVLNVLCDGLPKRLVDPQNAEKLALSCSGAVRLLVVLLTPLTAVSSLLINLLAKLFGAGNSRDNEIVTEEEILMMVDAGNETGVIAEEQKEMINNIFEFNDLSVSDIMTHRTDVTAVEASASVSKIVNASISSGFSRIPVYKDSIDHIIGMICVKDLLCMLGTDASSEATAQNFIRDVIYVPESMACGELFKKLTEKHMQMAVVADEYGGTAGVVTMEDVVESIVGNIQDEYDDESEDIIKISDDTYTIDGMAEPDSVLETLGITLPEDNDFDTMSGFIINLLGRIPESGESPSVVYENVKFTVLIVEDMCITKLKATIINENQDIIKENSENDKREEKN